MNKDQKDLDFVRSVAELLKELDLGEIEFTRCKQEGEELCVRVSAINHVVAPVPVTPSAGAGAASADMNPARHSVRDIDSTDTTDPAHHPGAVTAPMVGTVYLQPEPDAAPFIEIGQKVEAGDHLFIIEAMKTMNHVTAPRAGTVSRIFVENSSIVEFGSPLAIIE